MRKKAFSSSPVAGEAVSCLPASVRGRVGRSAGWLLAASSNCTQCEWRRETLQVHPGSRHAGLPPHQGAKLLLGREGSLQGTLQSLLHQQMPRMSDEMLLDTLPLCYMPPAATKAARSLGRTAPPPDVQQQLLVAALPDDLVTG